MAIFIESYTVKEYDNTYRVCNKCIVQGQEDDFSYYDSEGLNFDGGYSVDENGNIEYWDTDIIGE